MTPPSSTDRGDRENSHSTNFPNLCSVPLLHESGVGFGKINRVVGGWARDLTSILPSDPIDNSLPRSALSKSVTTKATCTLRHPSALRHCFLRSGRISEDRTNWRSSRTYLPGCSVRFRQIDRTGRTSLSPKLPNFCSSSSFVSVRSVFVVVTAVDIDIKRVEGKRLDRSDCDFEGNNTDYGSQLLSPSPPITPNQDLSPSRQLASWTIGRHLVSFLPPSYHITSHADSSRLSLAISHSTSFLASR
ncbi:hypothetical protein SISNIDRAFT_491982 [Sistotremastrum niveocremeum HHB9708]|uniref:Uncharacterized protein n=1 Tax=Sistotremastrum niveocremeum HHB9708 TaxID=1314777 RepID=A0A164M6G1_9AGAM|nr:hypothetical protein SISNIDRAFT_491982 [Sistotremastrum niveocremeum HHB9708]